MRDLDAPLPRLLVYSNRSYRRDLPKLRRKRKLLARELRKGRRLNGSLITRRQYKVWGPFYTAQEWIEAGDPRMMRLLDKWHAEAVAEREAPEDQTGNHPGACRMTPLESIGGTAWQIDSVLEKHAGQLEPVTLKLLKQLTANIRYDVAKANEMIHNFALAITEPPPAGLTS